MDWKKIKEKIAFNGWRKIIQKTFILPSGQEAVFDTLKGGDFVTIAAFTKSKEAILVKQYRPGPEQVLVSFPEGAIEKGESPMIAAARELEEETGYRAKKIVLLKNFRMAYRVDQRICVLALDCEKTSVQQLDSTEFIEIFTLSIEKFTALLTNSADDSFTTVDAGFLALHFLERMEVGG